MIHLLLKIPVEFRNRSDVLALLAEDRHLALPGCTVGVVLFEDEVVDRDCIFPLAVHLVAHGVEATDSDGVNVELLTQAGQAGVHDVPTVHVHSGHRHLFQYHEDLFAKGFQAGLSAHQRVP